MKLFNRQSKSDDNFPKEIKEYYDSEHRERVGVAWLVAFLSLIITVAIVIGVFFGGRWAYRKITNKDKVDTTTEQQTQDSPRTPSAGAGVENVTDRDVGSESANTSAAYSSSKSSSAVATAGATKLSDTGPGDTLAIFIAVSILAAIGHNLYLRRGKETI